jgi:phage baseplate assembly protein W
MKSLLLNQDGDLELDQFESVKVVEGSEEIKQQIKILLGTNRGEFFLDLNFGIPWLEWFRGEISEEEIRQEIVNQINDIEGVKEVEEINFDLVKESRKSIINFKVRLESEEEITQKEVV